jgi:dTDP-4-amino-4,6-dideoxygalactose transaminase
VGLNGKLSEFHAALGLLTMVRIEEALAVRQRHVAGYRQRLGSLPGLSFQRVDADDRSTFKDLAVLFTETTTRNRVELALTAAGIQTKRYFHPCHTMPAYRPFVDQALPVTESVYARILCLPLFEELTDDERGLVCSIVEEAAERPRLGRSRRRNGVDIRHLPVHAA